jgi:dynein heavy chain 1
VSSSDSVIPTLDTTRHEDLLGSWILDHRNVILCGPPGSGKTMILTCVLRSLSNYDACFLNFSSATQPDLILKTFDQYCSVVNTPKGLVLQPNQSGRWLVVFCDEINLPANDKYGTQRVVTFMRQIIEHKGYWRASDLQWIRLERIMFVGASNPPTDAGRVPLSERFLRHCPILFVDFPAIESLKQIYGTFNRALLKVVPNLVQYAEATTNTMVEFYTESQKHFTPDVQPHYVYSPRELSRWVRAMYEALKPMDTVSVEDYVRLLVHEGLRIFSDRLVLETDKTWTDEIVDSIVLRHFPNVDSDCVQRPLLFSAWIQYVYIIIILTLNSKNYVSVERTQLRDLLTQRLKSFAEEELEVKLVLFDSVLEHILRIDRVLKQPLGHLLLVGASGAGKTVLSRFCAWMNGFSVFQVCILLTNMLKNIVDQSPSKLHAERL